MDEDTRPEHVFRKSDVGRAALADRSFLAGKTRLALILVNGTDTLQILRAKLGADADALIGDLHKRGLIELLPAKRVREPLTAVPRPAMASPPVPPAPLLPIRPPAPRSPRSPPPPADESERLAPLKRGVVLRLQPHFGPEVGIVTAALLMTTTTEGYNAALSKIEARLALYLGKGGAARELGGLRG